MGISHLSTPLPKNPPTAIPPPSDSNFSSSPRAALRHSRATLTLSQRNSSPPYSYRAMAQQATSGNINGNMTSQQGFPEGDWWTHRESQRESVGSEAQHTPDLRVGTGMSDENLSQVCLCF